MRRHALHLITSGRQQLSEVDAVMRQVRHELADALHIREKTRTAREHIEWAERLRQAAPSVALIINDRLDAAAAVRADGVQLGYTSVPPDIARRILPPGTRIGCSVHSREEACAAEEAGADYVLFGHIYETASKAGLAGRGTSQLAQVVGAVDLPVIAIGGIDPGLVREVLATGCAGIAVMSSVFLHPSPGEQLERFRDALDASGFVPKRSFFEDNSKEVNAP